MDKQHKEDIKPENKADGKPESPQVKATWDHINNDLKSALDTWTELTGKMAHRLSPEEEQLREIKNILGTLKDKLNEFNDDPPIKDPEIKKP